MKLLKCNDVDIKIKDKVLFHIDRLDIEQGEKIGLIGLNGSGKTTFINELEKLTNKNIKRYGLWTFQNQYQKTQVCENLKYKSFWDIANLDTSFEKYSGGEKMRDALGHIFSSRADMYVFDEPTNNLDIEGVEKLKKMLKNSDSFILISHNRELLDELTNRTLVIYNNELIDFPDNYSKYKQWEAEDEKRQWREYKNYENEKKRLKEAAKGKRSQAKRSSKKPKGKSSSEIKQMNFGSLGKSVGGKEKALESQAKHIEKRIEQLEIKKKPKQIYNIRPEFYLTNPPKNHIVIQAQHLNLQFGNRILFDDLSFNLYRSEKVALIGRNGSGKSTLLSLIEKHDKAIYMVPKIKIGFLKQNMKHLNYEKTVYENLKSVSIQSETINRNILSRLGFDELALFKKTGILSGGEKIKLSLAMLCVSDVNMLILDEITNFLDIQSIEVVEKLIKEYEGSVLFVSHDTRFIDNIATEIWKIEDKTIKIVKTYFN